MNTNRATLYVESLPVTAVTRTQYFVLLSIAGQFKERFGATIMSNSELAAAVRMGERNLRIVLGELHSSGIVEYRPGLGSGNCSQFRFPALMREQRTNEEEKRHERGRKEEKSNAVIKEENLNLIQGPPLIPPAKCGGRSTTPPVILSPHQGIARNDRLHNRT